MCVADASLTNEPVRFDGDELPQSWTLRKYVCVVTGVAQLVSEPMIDVSEE